MVVGEVAASDSPSLSSGIDVSIRGATMRDVYELNAFADSGVPPP
jgi:hypothetical protein